MADEAILARRLEVEQRDEFVSGHESSVLDAPTIYAFGRAGVNARAAGQASAQPNMGRQPSAGGVRG